MHVPVPLDTVEISRNFLRCGMVAQVPVEVRVDQDSVLRDGLIVLTTLLNGATVDREEHPTDLFKRVNQADTCAN